MSWKGLVLAISKFFLPTERKTNSITLPLAHARGVTTDVNDLHVAVQQYRANTVMNVVLMWSSCSYRCMVTCTLIVWDWKINVYKYTLVIPHLLHRLRWGCSYDLHTHYVYVVHAFLSSLQASNCSPGT